MRHSSVIDRRVRLLLPLLLVWGQVAASASEVTELRLVPFPKKVQLSAGSFDLRKPLILELPENEGVVLASLLEEELAQAGLPGARVHRLAALTNAFRLTANASAAEFPTPPSSGAPEGYALEVRPGEVVCAASGPGGLVHGLQTLRQLIRANRTGDAVPCLQIADWPSLRWRAFQDDMTRGPSSKLETLQYEAGLGSFLKLNLMTFYMEYQFAFRKHPKVGPPDGSLTPGELAALVEFVKPLRLDILGNQQSFGHFAQILKHPEYAPLRETPEVLTPVNEATYRLLDDLYSEVCPLLPFPWFNVCCDETWGLGTGPSKELAAKIGVGGVYVKHIQRVHDLLKQRSKRMMMWGDIILQHPQQLGEIPRDTIMLTWGYDARPSFKDQILPFAQSGFEFFVCPGVNNWSRILPDFGVAMTNIQNFVRDGAQHGALGMINTDWEDDGEAINAMKWHADAWAAECAWNASTTSPVDFNRRVGAVLFGEKGSRFGQAVALLGQTHRLPGMEGMMNSRFWQADFVPRSTPQAIQRSASNLLAIVGPAIAQLEDCRAEAVTNRQVLDACLFGARRMERIGLRMQDGLEVAKLYARACDLASGPAAQAGEAAAARRGRAGEVLELLSRAETLVRTNRLAHDKLGKEFTALWVSESKPYALDWTTRRYGSAVRAYDDVLTKLATAKKAVATGTPIPQPEVIGLALPEASGRRTRPAETRSAPLAPEASWVEPSASDRIGLLVAAGGTDRWELPVETELALPAGLAAKPIRAFELRAGAPAGEIPAQLVAGEAPDKSRLVLLLPGPLPRGTTASVHVYLGLDNATAPGPSAVSTRPATNGMIWVENDKVRLLLGSEGGHIYRWEVKGLRNRDLTEPGETGWAGFCDVVDQRAEPYTITCLAAGPAVARFQCAGRSGNVRTISLYAGASWIDVLLGEPTSIFWNFDDPKNFAADGPTPGSYSFSDGMTGLVGKQADGVPAQVKARNVLWGIKYNPQKLALGMATPAAPALHCIAPGSGAGGVGIEGSRPVSHFVIFAGLLEQEPAETMNRLARSQDLRHQAEITLHRVQHR